MRALGIDDIINLPETIGNVVNFWSDPFGNMYKAGREAVLGLSKDVIPAITESTLPDLSLSSFLSSYAVSFALSIMLAVVLLILQFVKTARGKMSGQDLFDSIALYFPGFLIGITFGPAFGMLLIEFIKLLTRSIITWTYQGTVEAMVAEFGAKAVEDPSTIAGGAYIAFLIIWAMAIGLLIIPLIFVFQLVVQYFSGILIPLAVVWIVDHGRRHGGLGAVNFWVGMLFVQPLLFLMLGFAFRLNIDAIGQWGNDGFKNLVGLLIAVIAIFLAQVAPFVLIGWGKKHLAGQPASDGSATNPIGAPSPGRTRTIPGRGSDAPRGQQTVRSNATAANARGATASKIGAESAGTAGKATATKAGTATATKAGAGVASKAAGPVVAGASLAADGAVKATRKASETAHTSVTPPPVHGKERPQ